MRIGIFGGTFNPPHLGHLLLAQTALEQANLEKIIFIPCGNPPHKNGEEITDAKHRLQMTKLATCDNDGFDVSDIEIQLGTVSYTAKTLEVLGKTYPDATLCFMVGADSLCEMERWYHPELIFARAEIIVALRGGYDKNALRDAILNYESKYNARITPVAMPLIEISSSDIRRRLGSGKSVQYMLCDRVFEYICENRIYGV